MTVDRRLPDQMYDDRKRELRLKGWRNEEIQKQLDKEL